MRKRNLKLRLLAVLLLALILAAGCGDKKENSEAEVPQAVESATPETANPHSSGIHAIEAAKAAVAAHDCDGGCGMTKVPMVQLTEVDGKYYCAGCVEKAK